MKILSIQFCRASESWLVGNSWKDLSTVNSFTNTNSISGIRRGKTTQKTTANSQTGTSAFKPYKCIVHTGLIKLRKHIHTNLAFKMFFNNWLHESVIYNTFCPQKQKQMIELCRTEGQKLLFEGRYDRVVPAALESLKFAIEVYGLSSIELVPSYLILGEASIGQYHATSLMMNSTQIIEMSATVANNCLSQDNAYAPRGI